MDTSIDLVKCLLCGNQYKRITGFHLGAKHNITTEEYRIQFPDSIMEGLTWRKNNSNAQIGHQAWNKNLTKEEDFRLSYSTYQSERKIPKEYVIANCKHLIGTHQTEEQKIKRGIYNGHPQTEKQKQMMSILHHGKSHHVVPHTEETKRKISNSVKSYIDELPEELQKKRVSNFLEPNFAEQKLFDILERNFPNQWKYVGDGGIVLGRKIPDFLNINGKKQLIELFGKAWHEESDVENRVIHFRNYGFSTLVIWVTELSDEKSIVDKINNFS